MDAASYLKRQGWRGDGHSLDHTGRGIQRPLLVSKKVDVLGVGLNKHAAVSDQWWMRAFDQGLKDLGTGKRSALSDVREKGMSFGGLYGRFVKGEGVPGTFEEENMGGRKRKREEDRNVGVKSKKKAKTDVSGLEKGLSRDVRKFVDEAVRRALISSDEKKGPAKRSTGSKLVSQYGEDVVARVFKDAGLQDQDATKESNQDKYTRGKLQRAVKRAAREYLLGQMSAADRKAIIQSKSPDKGKAKLESNTNSSDEAAKDDKAKSKEAKTLKKRELREGRLAVREAFENNTDEIKISTTSKVKSKTIPGVGAVERYPTKAEKRAKKTQAQQENTPPKSNIESAESDSSSSAPGNIGFIVDDKGDCGLEGRSPSADSLSVIDSDGNVRYTCKPSQAVPLDPTIWLGIKPKLLPKPVRKARTEYMSQKREERQARKAKKAKP